MTKDSDIERERSICDNMEVEKERKYTKKEKKRKRGEV
jgi:hypothetical protein